jgi:hypothetical protein
MGRKQKDKEVETNKMKELEMIRKQKATRRKQKATRRKQIERN